MHTLRVAVLCVCMIVVESDRFCEHAWNGGLWRLETPVRGRTHLVVSHCGSSLKWLPSYANVTSFDTMTIISKCGLSPTPTYGAHLVTLPNVGRCDHTYAWWMLKEGMDLEDDDLVLFVKDSHHVSLKHSNLALANITLHVANGNGFACAIRPNLKQSQQFHPRRTASIKVPLMYSKFSLFAHTQTLDTFANKRGYKGGHVAGLAKQEQPFGSTYENLGEWRQHVRVKRAGERARNRKSSVVPMCFGGMFAAKVKNIKRQRHALQRALQTLSRADNIEEGHFMERSWAALLQDPLLIEDQKLIAAHTLKVAPLVDLKGSILVDCLLPHRNKEKKG